LGGGIFGGQYDNTGMGYQEIVISAAIDTFHLSKIT
jgi:hypothetical protein